MKALCGLLERLAAPSFIVLVGNDKLLANPTHRPTVVTAVAVVHVATARKEVQAPSEIRARSVERRTPNVAAAAYIVN